jgi:isohexenylglutaconyl-CoA hydratase
MDSSPLIRRRESGRHLTITLDDARRQNALSAEMVLEFERALDEICDRGLAALVIEGANGVFSAGADLKALFDAVLAPPAKGSIDPLEELSAGAGRFFARLAGLPALVIAVVDGPAVGGGMGLASAADIVIATARARFSLAETSLGFPPAQIAPHLVARLGERIARRLALTGSRLDGREAHALGLADFYCESEAERDANLESILQAVDRCAPGANAEIKRLLHACRVEAPEAYIQMAAVSFAQALRGAEGREGLAAFREKRAPSWVRRE